MSTTLKQTQKGRFRSFFRSGKWIAVVGIILLVGLGVALSREVARKSRINNEVAALEADIYSLERRNEELNGLIDYFQSDAFAEREAREKLNVQKPGEKVIEVQTPEVTPTQVAAAPAAAPLPDDNPQRWWVYLFAKRD
jgi:cell division protein DivIC